MELSTIPVVSAGPGGLLEYALDRREQARSLRDECVSWLPRRAVSLLPLLDSVTRRWLKRSRSPYVPEIAAIAASFGYPGIWFLNGSYEWGCTALAREQDGAPWLARTLDWPLPGLGRHLEIVRMQGAAGRFDNVTWPGYVGILTASAPGRFAASINQAPMRRRTKRIKLRPLDIAMNAMRTWRIRHIPPDHLLREVFETARSFGEAKQRLETTPIARPVIYTLVGCERGERCVIERTEESFETQMDCTATANDWLHAAFPWEARMRSEVLLIRTFDEAAANSRLRRETITSWSGRFAQGGFDWVSAPVLNTNTRLAVEMCPATGAMRAIGYEMVEGKELPQQVTRICELKPAVEGEKV